MTTTVTNATRNAILEAIKQYFNADGGKKFNLRKHLIKTYKVDTPKTPLESFVFALHHGHKNLRSRDNVVELFELLSIEANDLTQRKSGATKTTKKLVDYVFDVLIEVAGRDILSVAALNDLRPNASLRSVANWKQFQVDYQAKRKEFEQLGDTVFEFANVNLGDTDALEGVLVQKYNNYVADIGDHAFDWSNPKAWKAAEHNLRQSANA